MCRNGILYVETNGVQNTKLKKEEININRDGKE